MSDVSLHANLRGFQACPAFRFHAICKVFKHVRNSASILFARFSHPEFRFHAICGVFKAQLSVSMLFALSAKRHMSVTMLSSAHMSVTMLFAVFLCVQMSVTICGVFERPDVRYHDLRCFHASRCPLPCFCARGLRLYYKQSTFQPQKLRVSTGCGSSCFLKGAQAGLQSNCLATSSVLVEEENLPTLCSVSQPIL